MFNYIQIQVEWNVDIQSEFNATSQRNIKETKHIHKKKKFILMQQKRGHSNVYMHTLVSK